MLSHMKIFSYHYHTKKGLLLQLIVFLSTFIFTNMAYSTPDLDKIAAGNVSISQGSHTTTINQSSQQAIIEGKSFNIGANEATRFIQPNVNAVALNRIDSASGISKIYGSLSANGKIILINQAAGQGYINDPMYFTGFTTISSAINVITNVHFNINTIMNTSNQVATIGNSLMQFININQYAGNDSFFAPSIIPTISTVTNNIPTVIIVTSGNINANEANNEQPISQMANLLASLISNNFVNENIMNIIDNQNSLDENDARVQNVNTNCV
jgi:filamentous hemagglutinin family protein